MAAKAGRGLGTWTGDDTPDNAALHNAYFRTVLLRLYELPYITSSLYALSLDQICGLSKIKICHMGPDCGNHLRRITYHNEWLLFIDLTRGDLYMLALVCSTPVAECGGAARLKLWTSFKGKPTA